MQIHLFGEAEALNGSNIPVEKVKQNGEVVGVKECRGTVMQLRDDVRLELNKWLATPRGSMGTGPWKAKIDPAKNEVVGLEIVTSA